MVMALSLMLPFGSAKRARLGILHSKSSLQQPKLCMDRDRHSDRVAFNHIFCRIALWLVVVKLLVTLPQVIIINEYTIRNLPGSSLD